jgi:anti-sigma28 factor (negative regulator of flagellin synthesis)
MFLSLCGLKVHSTRLKIHFVFKAISSNLLRSTKLKEVKYNMEKKILGVFAFAAILVLAISAVSAFGNFGSKMSDEDRESLKTAVESGDYDSWATIKKAQISEAKFNEQRTRHQERAEFRALMQEARESGDYSRIQELKAEFGSGKGMNKQNMHSGECPFAK